jgi:beta-lactamase class A
MIRDSNNMAMDTLFHYSNPEAGAKMYDQLGITAKFKDPEDYISLKKYVGLFRILYNATYLNEEMSEKALNYLVDTQFDKGIAAGVPEEVTVANKFGEFVSPETRLKQLHDVGIVYHPDNPYLLGIMTRGGGYDKLAEVIKTISTFIYTEVDQQYKRQDAQNIPYGFEEEG